MKRNYTKKEILMIALGILIAPFLFILYMIDRVITTFIPVIQVTTIQKWLMDPNYMGSSILRVSTAAIIYGVYLLIRALI